MTVRIVKYSLLLLLIVNAGFSQGFDYLKSNEMYVDSVEACIKKYVCNDSIIYPKSYENNILTTDLNIIHNVNLIFPESVSLNQTLMILNKMKIQNEIKETKNGLISIFQLKLKGHYIQADVRFESVGKDIFRKKVKLYFNSNGHCNKSASKILDFNLLRKYLIPKINFEIKISDREYLVANYFQIDVLRKASLRFYNYSFGLDSLVQKDDLSNTIILNQYNDDSSRNYSFSIADQDFVRLIRNGRSDLIIQFLYSPNYLYSINAMESLIYLQNKKGFIVDKRMQERFIEITNASFPVHIQKSYDLYETVSGYPKLLSTSAIVVDKFSRAMN